MLIVVSLPTFPTIRFIVLLNAVNLVFPVKIASPATVPPSVKFKLLSIKSTNWASVGLSPVLK